MKIFAFVCTAFLCFCIFIHCTNSNAGNQSVSKPGKTSVLQPGETVLSKRFLPPKGFSRVAAKENSFAAYLRNISLKPHGTKVKLYNGNLKENQVGAAVLDIETGTENLQQCADAVMRLRAEYLYKTKQYNKIHFNFTNGFKADYTKWMQGNRIFVKGENVSWKKTREPSNTYKDFREYIYMVFRYAGTLSLSKELQPVAINQIKCGDVFIIGGSPGHAVIVMDVAQNTNGEKVFMLAQSYMPAQDIHILVNNDDEAISPWYKMPAENMLQTPEWTFATDQLMRFKEE